MLRRLFARFHTSVYRLTGGRLGGRWGKAPVLLLTTTGRRTGTPRTTPLLYLPDGEAFVVVATNDGAPEHPNWYVNLRKEPEATVQAGPDRIEVRAEDADDEARERLWPRLVAIYASYERDQRRTERVLPVVVLRRRV